MKNKLDISKDDLLKACIHIGCQDFLNDLQNQAIHRNNLVNLLVDNIYSKIKGINNFHENFQKYFSIHPLLLPKFWYLYNLSGLTTMWEFHVRILAARIEVSSNKPIEQKSKKSRNLRMLQWVNLKEIINQLNEKISP